MESDARGMSDVLGHYGGRVWVGPVECLRPRCVIFRKHNHTVAVWISKISGDRVGFT